MPVDWKRYPKNWREIRDRIIAKSGGRCMCEGECGLHNKRRCIERNGEPAKWAKGKVVLTVAHLNHDTADSSPSNLKAMCQRCHLRYDVPHHMANARRTRDRKSGQLSLWIVPNADVFEIAKSAGKDYANGDKLREYDFRRGYEQGMMAYGKLVIDG